MPRAAEVARLRVQRLASVNTPAALPLLGAAPPWQVERWLNTPQPLSLAALRGRVLLVHAFQMLCPGCVLHALPQTQRVAAALAREDFAVIGLHSVFEHHAAMQPEALQVFLHEYGVDFPVAIDANADDDPLPATMRAYGLRGTPSTLLIDRSGRLRLHHFGVLEDFALGVVIGQLLSEPAVGSPAAEFSRPPAA